MMARLYKKFDGEFLSELVYECDEGDSIDGFTVIEFEYVQSTRWSETWTMVFSHGGKYYRVEFEKPATEYQDVDTFDADCDGYVPCLEVKPIEKIITVFRAVEVGNF